MSEKMKAKSLNLCTVLYLNFDSAYSWCGDRGNCVSILFI